MFKAPLTIEEMIERYPGTNRQTWAQYRYRGVGPAYIKVGRNIYYPPEDVQKWEESRKATRTDKRPSELTR